MDSVDYVDTFITVAPDCTAAGGQAPPERAGAPTVASRTFELVHGHPYEYTSGDVIFTVMADRKGIPEIERAAARAEFYSRGQPCLRSSDLGKRYGWGIHADGEGRVAAYARDSAEYEALASGRSPGGDPVKVVAAMRSRRA